ncbi:glycosyltransferase family 4 protein [Flavobacterium sp. ZS1P14]|uniref:glycosyltransferase family 4 protein n=1 Tax=Flavobacterium sp. ZS1P14 TaxID=3401729 RepID=UPI003AABA006
MRILLVCESSHIYESGGRVVRYITKFLKEKNNQVKLVVLSEQRDDFDLNCFYKENDVVFLPLRKNLRFRIGNLLYKTKELKRFREVLNEFSPEIVHFASFDSGKPPQFISDAKKFGAKVVLQPWTMQFYCAQGFGFRDGEKCTLCANGNFLNALTKKCVTYKGIPSLIEKKILHNRALEADVLLSSNTELDKILLKYGIKEDKISRFPIPFDCGFLKQKEENEEDYFIFYGQANSHKGLNVLIKIFELLPEQKLKIYPLSNLPENTIKNSNIEIINGVNWSNGLEDAILNSKAVLMPSLWSTSTEYALCEALLMKKPVVVFNVGVHRDIFKNKFNAMVIESNDIISFAKAIVELDQDEKLRKIIGENGFKTLLAINTPDNVYSKLLFAYKQ